MPPSTMFVNIARLLAIGWAQELKLVSYWLLIPTESVCRICVYTQRAVVAQVDTVLVVRSRSRRFERACVHQALKGPCKAI